MEHPASAPSECTLCPPAWLPARPDGNPRVIRCSHYEGELVVMYTHYDMPSVMCVCRREGRKLHNIAVYLSPDEAEAAFHEAEEALLRGDA
jgi:hypothetical protein